MTCTFKFRISDSPLPADEIGDFEDLVKLDAEYFEGLSWGYTKMRSVCNQAFTLTAYINGVFAAGLTGRLYFSSKAAVSFYINSFAVKPCFQRLKVGVSMLRKLEDELGRRDVYHLTLHCSKQVKTFYVKNGFQIINKSPLLMEKII